MCGISGFYSKKLGESDIQRAITAQNHRGPDSNGYFLETPFALIHNRLSILDLSDLAHQPMRSQDGRYLLTYNGEIYNYQQLRSEYQVAVNSSGDTELLLELFSKIGTDVFSKLNGIFAGAIYDTQKKSLLLFRDHLGIKPLYYYRSEEDFVFASELKGISALVGKKESLKPSKAAINTFLHLGFIPAPLSIYDNVQKLEPGSWLEFDGKEVVTNTYWQPLFPKDPPSRPRFEDSKKQLNDLLHESVSGQMVSDVPVGAFLSGGIDSSLVTALATKYSGQKLKTFTIGFKEAKFDESEHARKVSKHLNTDHTEFILSTDDAKEQVLNLLNIYDEPFGDSSAIPTLMISKLAAAEVKVILSGDGGDELFFGYNRHVWMDRLLKYRLLQNGKTIAPLIKSVPHTKFKRLGDLLDVYDDSMKNSHYFSQQALFFSEYDLDSMMSSGWRKKIDRDESNSIGSNINAHTLPFWDLTNYLPDDNLTKVDRASMFHSLEVRVPLLDYRVVEMALKLPLEHKYHKGHTKHILKEVLYDYVPKKLFDRPKQGFSIPVNEWLRSDLRFLIDDYLNEAVIEEQGIFNYSEVRKIKDQFLKGNNLFFNKIWSLTLIQKWMIDHHLDR